MTAQELATAVQYDIPVVYVVANNVGWIAIRDLQAAVYGEERARRRRVPQRIRRTHLARPGGLGPGLWLPRRADLGARLRSGQLWNEHSPLETSRRRGDGRARLSRSPAARPSAGGTCRCRPTWPKRGQLTNENVEKSNSRQNIASAITDELPEGEKNEKNRFAYQYPVCGNPSAVGLWFDA